MDGTSKYVNLKTGAILEWTGTTWVTQNEKTRQAHATAVAGTNCNLVWSTPFTDTNYSFTVNGYDSHGNPVEFTLVSILADKIIVRTLIACKLMAIALPN